MSAAHFEADNLVAILDYNKYQETGPISREMALEPLVEKWESFGWNVVEADGHDIADLLEKFDAVANVKGKPSIIIAHTVKGKGVSFVEADFIPRSGTDAGTKQHWHGRNSMELGKQAGLKPYPLPLRNVFGDALLNVARENEKVVVLDGDLGNSTKAEYVRQEFPERFFNIGIAESNLVGVGAGLAGCGFVPWITSFLPSCCATLTIRFDWRSRCRTSTQRCWAAMAESRSARRWPNANGYRGFGTDGRAADLHHSRTERSGIDARRGQSGN